MQVNHLNKVLVKFSSIDFYMSSPYFQAFNNLVPLNKKDSRTIVFIDSSVDNCEDIAQQVISSARVIIIGSADDGVKEISKILNASNCIEVHIFSSGFPGCMYLGRSELSLDTFRVYTLLLKSWFYRKRLPKSNSFAHRIHLYSKNLNVGDSGEEFTIKLSQLTKAKVCISSNIADSVVLNDAD